MKKKILSIVTALVLFLSLAVPLMPATEVEAATQGSVDWELLENQYGVSSTPTQRFTIRNTGDSTLYYEIAGPTSEIDQIAAGATITRNFPATEVYSVWLCEDENLFRVVAENGTLLLNEYNIYYVDQAGNVLLGDVIESGQVAAGDPFDFIADDSFFDGTSNWLLNDSKVKKVQQGTINYYFQYVKDTSTKTVYFSYFDEVGRKIGGSNGINVDNVTGATFTPEETLKIGGSEYVIKADDFYERVIPANFMELADMDFSVNYELVKDVNDKDYSIYVEFGVYDENGQLTNLLDRKSFTANETSTDIVKFTNIQDTYSVFNQETKVKSYYIKADGEPTVIEHDPASKTRTYKVKYVLDTLERPYNWRINYLDLNGKTIDVKEPDTVRSNIEVNSNFNIDNPLIVEVPETVKDAQGNEFVRLQSTPSKLYHIYGESDRVIDVIFMSADDEALADYDIKVQYMNVANFKVLKTLPDVTAKVEENGATFDTEQSFELDGTEYIRLAGQEDTMSHKFYSKQRTYTIYYRDKDDLANADTVVNVVEEIPNYIDEVVEGEAEGTDTAGTATPNTVISNETTGETTVLDDGGVPLSEGLKNKVGVKDEKVPAGSGEKEAAASAQPNWPVMISLAALALALIIGAAFFVAKKKKSANDVEGNDQN